MRQQYLGDGVYVDFDGYHIVLTTEREGIMHTIYLDSPTFGALKRYDQQIREMVQGRLKGTEEDE